LYDAERDRYLVSNVNGDATAADDNGFVSVLSPDGTITDLRWIAGGKDGVALNAPKGLALANGSLYVADIDSVRLFDAETGAFQRSLTIEGSTYLNGVSAAPDGRIYVTDSGPPEGTLDAQGTEAVYVIDGTTATKLASGDLGRPTSATWTSAGLVLTAFGKNELYRVDERGTKRSVTELPAGGLAGLVELGDTLYVTSWQASAIFKGKLGGKFELALANQSSPTDFGFDTTRGRFLLPHFTDDRVEVFEAR
jgi:sugar lactone lactonase YvrE